MYPCTYLTTHAKCTQTCIEDQDIQCWHTHIRFYVRLCTMHVHTNMWPDTVGTWYPDSLFTYRGGEVRYTSKYYTRWFVQHNTVKTFQGTYSNYCLFCMCTYWRHEVASLSYSRFKHACIDCAVQVTYLCTWTWPCQHSPLNARTIVVGFTMRDYRTIRTPTALQGWHTVRWPWGFDHFAQYTWTWSTSIWTQPFFTWFPWSASFIASFTKCSE
jgi:hypothetical protein